MTRNAMLRLNDAIAKRICKLVEAKGIPFATMCRSLIIERLREIEQMNNRTRLAAKESAKAVRE